MQVDLVTQEDLQPIIRMLEQLTSPKIEQPRAAKNKDQRLRIIEIDPRMGLTVEAVAESLSCDPRTVRANMRRPVADPLYLPSFAIAATTKKRTYRIHYKDLEAFIERNYFWSEIRYRP